MICSRNIREISFVLESFNIRKIIHHFRDKKLPHLVPHVKHVWCVSLFGTINLIAECRFLVNLLTKRLQLQKKEHYSKDAFYVLNKV